MKNPPSVVFAIFPCVVVVGGKNRTRSRVQNRIRPMHPCSQAMRINSLKAYVLLLARYSLSVFVLLLRNSAWAFMYVAGKESMP